MKIKKFSGKYLFLQGFKNIKIDDIESIISFVKTLSKDSHVQLLDAKFIAGYDHIYFSFLNALNAFNSGRSISKDLALETLLYISGKHQIEKAIKLVGVQPSSSMIVLLVISISEEEGYKTLNKITNVLDAQDKICDKVIEMSEKKICFLKTAYNLNDLTIQAVMENSEEDAITHILIERGALLPTRI
jgi:tRNA threonylcarbamoyladenosine modification (KEOPS) complex Cgi121 subunit